MRAPRQTRCNAILDRGGGRIDSGPRAPQRALHERRAPWKADPPLLVLRQRSGQDPAHVPAVVHAEQLLVGGGMRLDEPEGHPGRRMGLEPAAEQAVFGRREAVALGQRQRVAI